jgi:hypothetical protein
VVDYKLRELLLLLRENAPEVVLLEEVARLLQQLRAHRILNEFEHPLVPFACLFASADP